MKSIIGILHNYPLIAGLAAWIIAQLAKTLLDLVTNKKFNKELLTASGGMPSSHSATVCALTLAIGRTSGLNSAAFAIAVIMAAVVMYDAMGVRYSSGEQAKVLNKIILLLRRTDCPDDNQKQRLEKTLKSLAKPSEQLDAEEEDDEELKQIKEKLGHTPLQVLAGALLGIVVALLIPISI